MQNAQVYNHQNFAYISQTIRFERFHKVTKTQGREGKIPTYVWLLGRLNSILPSLTLCSVYQKVFVMFTPNRVPFNLAVSLWGKTEDSFQSSPTGFSDSISVPCWDVMCKSRELGASGSKWQQSRAWCPRKKLPLMVSVHLRRKKYWADSGWMPDSDQSHSISQHCNWTGERKCNQGLMNWNKVWERSLTKYHCGQNRLESGLLIELITKKIRVMRN